MSDQNKPEQAQPEKSIISKFFMRFQFNLIKVNITILKSLENEERKLLENHNCLSDETEYKEYLTFILNNFYLNVDMREDLYLEVSSKIFNFFLIDKDYVWQLNQDGNISEYPILNQEFQVNLKLQII